MCLMAVTADERDVYVTKAQPFSKTVGGILGWLTGQRRSFRSVDDHDDDHDGHDGIRNGACFTWFRSRRGHGHGISGGKKKKNDIDDWR